MKECSRKNSGTIFCKSGQALTLSTAGKLFINFEDYNSQVDIAGLQWFQWFSILLTLVTNGYMIHFIMRQQSKTFLDWMIVFDSGLCINQCYAIAAIGSRIQTFCRFSVIFINRLYYIHLLCII